MDKITGKKFDTTPTRCSEKTFGDVKSVIKHLRGDALIARLEELFEGGVPANGYIVSRGGTAFTYLSLATDTFNEDALEYLIRRNYEDLVKFNWRFSNYLWSKRAVEALLELGHSFAKEIEDPKCDFWSNAMHLGQDFFKSIAERGARLDIPLTSRGRTEQPIIQFAVGTAGPKMVETLLAVGADPAIKSREGASLLHRAVTQGSALHSKEFDSPENAAGLERIVRAVLGAGGDVDMVDDEGRTALHMAAKMGYAGKARVLIEAGADPLRQAKDGSTPEDLARASKRRAVLQIFAVVHAHNAITNVVATATHAAPKASTQP